mmetsp:Transcript_10295/g.21612  ORF Transcript_10295/g.21612 Transcript_10295/m.21612 type:complete len:225 (+) Transcript_10295:924-1598(+)
MALSRTVCAQKVLTNSVVFFSVLFRNLDLVRHRYFGNTVDRRAKTIQHEKIGIGGQQTKRNPRCPVPNHDSLGTLGSRWQPIRGHPRKHLGLRELQHHPGEFQFEAKPIERKLSAGAVWLFRAVEFCPVEIQADGKHSQRLWTIGVADQSEPGGERLRFLAGRRKQRPPERAGAIDEPQEPRGVGIQRVRDGPQRVVESVSPGLFRNRRDVPNGIDCRGNLCHR